MNAGIGAVHWHRGRLHPGARPAAAAPGRAGGRHAVQLLQPAQVPEGDRQRGLAQPGADAGKGGRRQGAAGIQLEHQGGCTGKVCFDHYFPKPEIF